MVSGPAFLKLNISLMDPFLLATPRVLKSGMGFTSAKNLQFGREIFGRGETPNFGCLNGLL